MCFLTKIVGLYTRLKLQLLTTILSTEIWEKKTTLITHSKSGAGLENNEHIESRIFVMLMDLEQFLSRLYYLLLKLFW